MPALELYQGVMYQTYRTHCKPYAAPWVVILSAKHGFIGQNRVIEPYDQKMTPQKTCEMLAGLEQGIANCHWPKGIRHVFLAGGAQYQCVMRAAVSLLMQKGAILQDAHVGGTSGGIGYQRAQLGQYLREIPDSTRVVNHHPNGTPVFDKAWGYAIGDTVAIQNLRDQDLRAVVRELFYGPGGPTADVEIQRKSPRRFPEGRWVGINSLEGVLNATGQTIEVC